MDRHQSKRGQTAPATSAEASVDQDAKGRALSQTDTPARPSAEHSAHAVGHPHCTATRIKASVDDLPHRLAMARRGYLTLASSRPSQLARFLSSHMALVVEIYKGTAGTGHFWIPTTTARSAC